MTFTDLQNKIVKRAFAYGKENKISIDSDFSILKLYEEVGEFTQALLIHNKKSRPSKHVSEKDSHQLVSQELADVLCLTILNAYLLKVDLEEAIKKKWLSKK